MLPGVMVMDLGYRLPERDTPAVETRSAEATDETPNWFVRASLGLGSVPRSDQRDLFDVNGYENSGIRWHNVIDAAGFPWPHVGLGGFAGYAWRTVEPKYGGPDLEESIFRLGAEVPVTAGTPAYRFILAPRLGVVHGRQSLHDDGDFVTGPLVGAAAGLMFPKIHLGFQFGWYYAPVPASGHLGERDDFGGVDFSLAVYFDG
jgi:hypothetical protein